MTRTEITSRVSIGASNIWLILSSGLDKYNPDYIIINNQFSDYKIYNLIRENESIPLHDYLPAKLGNRGIHFIDKLNVAYNYLKSNYSIIYNNEQEEVLLFQHN